MKLQTLFILLIISTQLISQQFIEKVNSNLAGIEKGSSAIADIDNDNDLDLLITGLAANQEIIANLYLNDGSGNFTLNQNSGIIPVFWGDIAFADVDNDNDQDLLVTGRDKNWEYSTILYLNDGLGNFSFALNTMFINVGEGSVEFADIDNDQDMDILITGEKVLNGIGDPQSLLYKNDGLGNFTEVPNEIVGIKSGASAFADFNNDGHIDLVVCGSKGVGGITELYTNDGSGDFERTLVRFDPLSYASVAAFDANNDGTQDLLICGEDFNRVFKSILYLNQGNLEFTESGNNMFPEISITAIANADIDGDQDIDLLFTGRTKDEVSLGEIYVNDGLGAFSKIENLDIAQIKSGSVNFGDIDGDSDQDLIMSGNLNDVRVSKIYLNTNLSSISNQTPRANFSFLVQPNPTSDYISINSNGNIQPKSGKILNNQGEVVLNINSLQHIDISHLDDGIYYLQVLLNDGYDLQPFIISN